MNVPQTVGQNLPATSDPNYNPYAAFADELSQSRIVGHLLKFTKFGEFVAGQDAVVVPLGTRMIAHMGELLTGWQRWQDNRPVEQVMGFPRDNFQVPKRETLGSTDSSQWEVDDNGKERDPWQRTVMLILKDVDSDELYTFSTSSKGGLNSMANVGRKYAATMKMRPDEYPVVELGFGTYDHPNKQYGEIRFPTFEVVDWAPKAVIEKALAGLRGDNQEPLPLEVAPPAQPEQQKQQTYADASGRAAAQQKAAQAPPKTNQAQQQSRQAQQQPQQQNRKTRF